MKPFVGKCRRCKTWEVTYRDLDGEFSYCIEGFKSWREAINFAMSPPEDE